MPGRSRSWSGNRSYRSWSVQGAPVLFYPSTLKNWAIKEGKKSYVSGVIIWSNGVLTNTALIWCAHIWSCNKQQHEYSRRVLRARVGHVWSVRACTPTPVYTWYSTCIQSKVYRSMFYVPVALLLPLLLLYVAYAVQSIPGTNCALILILHLRGELARG